MCGLAGIFGYGDNAPRVDAAELMRMRERMVVRGPDGAGSWISSDGRVGLAHRRLAIIELSALGAQPMESTNGRYQIVFNGEIYNYQALRDELISQGAVFKSHSDTEVLLELYARAGEKMGEILRGMYAFAIWDKEEHSLFLARDPFGMKPLYVHDDGKTLRFASQVKALMAGGVIPFVPEPAGIVGYWLWGHVPEPWTMYQDVVSVDPGTWLKIDVGGKKTHGVFESVAHLLTPPKHLNETSSPAIGIEKDLKSSAANGPAMNLAGSSVTHSTSLREALLDSVKHHLIADVPVGVFLSAGIDSATLTALAAECGSSLRTVTLGFEEYRDTPNDETVLAEQVAKQYGSIHHTVWISEKDFATAREAFFEDMDQPTTDGLNTWLVARAAAQLGLKVAISGLGGDEFFAGYPSFTQVPKIRRLTRPLKYLPLVGKLWRQVSSPLIKKISSPKYASLLEYGPSWFGAYFLRRATRMRWELADIDSLTPEQIATGLKRLQMRERVLENEAGQLEKRAGAQAAVSYLEATIYMRDRLLRDSDWAGMAHSVEIRMPLVDLKLTKCIVVHNAKQTAYTKRDLATCAKPHLPNAITNRPKTGFVVPVKDWMMRSIGQENAVEQRGLRAWQSVIAEIFSI